MACAHASSVQLVCLRRRRRRRSSSYSPPPPLPLQVPLQNHFLISSSFDSSKIQNLWYHSLCCDDAQILDALLLLCLCCSHCDWCCHPVVGLIPSSSFYLACVLSAVPRREIRYWYSRLGVREHLLDISSSVVRCVRCVETTCTQYMYMTCIQYMYMTCIHVVSLQYVRRRGDNNRETRNSHIALRDPDDDFLFLYLLFFHFNCVTTLRLFSH